MKLQGFLFRLKVDLHNDQFEMISLLTTEIFKLRYNYFYIQDDSQSLNEKQSIGLGPFIANETLQ